MTDDKELDPLTFMERAAASRGPGKRQIKLVNQNELLGIVGLGMGDDDEEEDEDYNGGESVSDEQDEESSSSSSDDEQSDSDDSEHKNGLSKSASVASSLFQDGEFSNMSTVSKDVGLICCLCLNVRDLPDGEQEVVQCDKCGLSVHEACYGLSDVESVLSGQSGTVTEPWFCEPCIAGIKEPPYCQLCPNREGAFKRTDAGGWVHLLCALYTLDVTFGDVDRLSNVSFFELDYKRFGHKACCLCADRVSARTGICSQCDAALCKSYFHITCAFKKGLLVDSSQQSSNSKDVADPYFVCCHKHSDVTQMRLKRRRFEQLEYQDVVRLHQWRGKKLNEREQSGLIKRRAVFDKQNKAFNQKYLWLPQGAEKWPRLCHTSAELLSMMEEKAEQQLGMDKEQFDKKFRTFKPELVNNSMPPAFGMEFCMYYSHREEKLIPQTATNLEHLRKSTQQLRQKQEKIEDKYKKSESLYDKEREVYEKDYKILEQLHKTLTSLNCKNLPQLSNFEPKQISPGRVRHSSSSARRTSSPSRSKMIHTCHTCHKSTDQHLLSYCDTCHKHNHLACLDPPLTKMPRKSSLYGWECSSCAQPDSDEDEESNEPNVNEPRQLRGRQAKSVWEIVQQQSALKEISSSPQPRRRHTIVSKSKSKPKSVRKTGGSESAPEMSPKRRGRPKINKKNKNHKIEDDANDNEIKLDDDSLLPDDSLMDGLVLDIHTTKRKKFERMRYPEADLNSAVDSVLNGTLNVKRASEKFGIPRSTLGTRVTLMRGGDKKPIVNPVKKSIPIKRKLKGRNSTLQLTDEQEDQLIDVGTPKQFKLEPKRARRSSDVDVVGIGKKEKLAPIVTRSSSYRRDVRVIRVEDLDL